MNGRAERVAVVVATRGRAAEVAILLDRLAGGTRRPDQVVIVGHSPGDWAGTDRSTLPLVTLAAPEPGLPRQRNAGVRHLLDQAERPDIIVFFDDDFRPHPGWLEAAVAVFRAEPDIVGLTGTLLRDGAKTAAVTEAEAADAIAGWVAPSGAPSRPVSALYGCNMAVRGSVFDHIRFDERLPLYGWLEDLDFSGQLKGRLVTARAGAGVHLGAKGARVSGRRYGYSQIVNPLYLARKGTCPKGMAAVLVVRALVSNTLRSTRRHPVFDYRGRLNGNLTAVRDILGRKARPERILEL